MLSGGCHFEPCGSRALPLHPRTPVRDFILTNEQRVIVKVIWREWVKLTGRQIKG